MTRRRQEPPPGRQPGRARRLLTGNAGAAAVEAAIILPVLILFLMMIMEGGHVLSVWMVLSNQTREAARYGVAAVRSGDASQPGSCVLPAQSQPQPPSLLQCEVATYQQQRIAAILNNTTPLTVNVSLQSVGSAPNQYQRVLVNSAYTVYAVTPIIQALAPSITTTAQAVMRAEG